MSRWKKAKLTPPPPAPKVIYKKLDVAELAIVQGLLYAIDPMLKLNGRLPLRCLQAFLAVGFEEGKSVSWYAKRTAIRPASMSRNLLNIGPRNRYMKDGYGLVQGWRNPDMQRELQYFLSPKGRALLGNMLNRIRPAA